ncbi:MAG: TlpA disulfide reductase family protein [Pirellulaceae bacterium]
MTRCFSRNTCKLVVSLAVSLMLCGCQPPDAASDAEGVGGSDATPVDESAGDAADAAEPAKQPIEIRVVDRAGYDEVIAKHKGNVVLVDFWATWCEPCKEQFPEHTVALFEKYGDSGLATVSVSFDDASQQADALKFLKQHHATFDNLLSEYGIGTESFEKFEIDGGVPHYKLYDRDGQLRYSFSDQLEEREGVEPTTDMRIEIRIKELLAEK